MTLWDAKTQSAANRRLPDGKYAEEKTDPFYVTRQRIHTGK